MPTREFSKPTIGENRRTDDKYFGAGCLDGRHAGHRSAPRQQRDHLAAASEPFSLRRTSPRLAGSGQSLNGAPFKGPLKKAKASVVRVEHHLLGSRGYAHTNSIRLWHSRTRATLTVTVVPLISTTSSLQSNWKASLTRGSVGFFCLTWQNLAWLSQLMRRRGSCDDDYRTLS